MNELNQVGILVAKNKFSEKVGSFRLKVKSTGQDGKTHEENFFWTAFSNVLASLDDIPLGAVVSCNGRLRNSSYEKNGVKTWKTEPVLNKVKLLEMPKEEVRDLSDDVPF